MDELNTLRKDIDMLDEKIMGLLEKRFEISEHVGTLKKNTTLAVSHPDREQEILNKSKHLKHNEAIKTVYKQIFKLSKQIQK